MVGIGASAGGLAALKRFFQHVPADSGERMRAEQLLALEVERGRLEEEVHNRTNELAQTRDALRALTGHLMTAQEQERRRLARELHDDFGQRMALLSLNADRALKQIHTNPRESEDLLRSIGEDLSIVNQGLREVSHRLHPSVIEDLGLIAAIQSLAQSYRENGNEVTCWVPEQIPQIPLDTATALYRITQEALRNAQKHAAGAPVHVSLTTQDGSMRLTIRDAGRGFDVAQAANGGGLGLLSMKERARLANAKLLVKSRPEEGTEISVSVPG